MITDTSLAVILAAGTLLLALRYWHHQRQERRDFESRAASRLPDPPNPN